MLTQTQLKELFDYDPVTGIFVYRKDRIGRGHPVRAGDVAGHKKRDGYTQIGICGKYYKAHRLAWLYVYGEFPSVDIDHRNGDRSDNRIDNLRVASRAQNCANRKLQVTNRIRLKGVFFDDGMKERKYGARICEHGKLKIIGFFLTPEEAHAAYVEAARKIFGEFARAG